MQEPFRLSVIIPCYNEEETLALCLQQIPRLKEIFEIIIVDDGSSDNTYALAQNIKNQRPDVKLIRFLKNKGKAQAVFAGIENAAGEFVAIQDADMSIAPQNIALICEELKKDPACFIMGTRFKLPMEKYAMPFKNYIANKLTAFIFSRLLKQKISDNLCGMKAFKKDLAIEISDCRWPDFDLIIAAYKQGRVIKEIPLTYAVRRGGDSKMRLYPDVWGLFLRILKACRQIRCLKKR